MKKFLITFIISALTAAAAYAARPLGIRDMLEAHTAVVWIDAQFLDELVLNARARLAVTWLPRRMAEAAEDMTGMKWASNGLNYYYRNDAETRKKLKGRDVLAVNWRADKNWIFDPTEISAGGFRITSDDILGDPKDLIIGDMPSGSEGTLYICVPSLKGGRTLRIEYGPDSADITLPKK